LLARNGERPATDDAVNGARKSGNGSAETSKPHIHQAQASIQVDRYALHHDWPLAQTRLTATPGPGDSPTPPYRESEAAP
jgi:hypothetical protein